MIRKPHAPEDDLQEALDDMARDIALIEPDPQYWGWWLSNLMEQLEGETEKHQQIEQFGYTLEVLVETIQKRIEGGKW